MLALQANVSVQFLEERGLPTANIVLNVCMYNQCDDRRSALTLSLLETGVLMYQ